MSQLVNEGFDCTGIFDSHAHYFDTRFKEETEGADVILKRDVFGRGIDGVINIGTNNENSRICIAQAQKYEKMYATVGIHPEDVGYCKGSVDEELAQLCELFATPDIRKKNKVVALGEIGLDYHYEGFDKALQQEYFDRQLDIAKQYDLPVVIHDRDAHGDCFETVIRHGGVRGVFHSFSGSREMAMELVKRGWYISFSGVLTFKNARKCVEVAEAVPMDKILIETDCPYLAPHPYRGKINHSGLMYLTAQKLAEIKGISYSEAVAKTRENVRELFGV
ncbi:MAG: TatD family deoxyribonuclease [Ruminococcaceae bacterium]|nr:TatD family deoxyribonuclease [Oscillospiraceae bacterium]